MSELITILNDGDLHAKEVNFPITVEAVRSGVGFNVKGVYLIEAGFEFIHPDENYYFSTLMGECEEYTPQCQN